VSRTCVLLAQFFYFAFCRSFHSTVIVTYIFVQEAFCNKDIAQLTYISWPVPLCLLQGRQKIQALAYIKFRQVFKCPCLPLPVFLEQFCPGWTDFWNVSVLCSVLILFHKMLTFLCCSVLFYFCVVLCIVCFVSFYVLFVCKCVLYYCHWVATQLQLTNI
jgi:hypothetical protein